MARACERRKARKRAVTLLPRPFDPSKYKPTMVRLRDGNDPPELIPLLGDILGALVEKLADVTNESVKGAMRYGRWALARWIFGDTLASNFFNTFLTAEKHQITGFSPDGVVKLWMDGLDTTIRFGIIVGPEIIDEFIGEMIQEGMSQAIQTNMGGAFQTIVNVYRGAAPLYTNDLINLGQHITGFDPRLSAFLAAAAGCNLPSTGGYLVFGARQALDDSMRVITEQMIRHLEDWNEATFVFIRVAWNMARQLLLDALHLKREIAERYARIRERIAETHLARANEYLDSLEALKRWYEAGMLGDEDLKLAVARIQAEIEASQTAYDEALEALDEAYQSALQQVEQRVTTAVSLLYDAISLYRTFWNRLARKADEVMLDQVGQVADYLSETLDGVSSYRNLPMCVFPRAVRPVMPETMPIWRKHEIRATLRLVVAEKVSRTAPLMRPKLIKEIANRRAITVQITGERLAEKATIKRLQASLTATATTEPGE